MTIHAQYINGILQPISLGEVMNEFGWPTWTDGNGVVHTDRRLGRFYKGGGLVPNVSANANIVTAGQISLGMFYGARKVVPISGRYIINASLVLDYDMYITINFATGQRWVRAVGFYGGDSTFNFSTGAGTEPTSVPQRDEFGQPLMQIIGYDMFDQPIYAPVMGPGPGASGWTYAAPWYYFAADPRTSIANDGIGSSFQVADIGQYSSMTMNISCAPFSLYSVVHPSAANNWVGSFRLIDHERGDHGGALVVTLDAN